MPAPHRSPARPPRPPRVAGRRSRPGSRPADPSLPDVPVAAPNPTDPTTADPAPADPTAADPAPADPTPATADLTPADLTPADLTRADPTTAEPTTAEPTTAEPTAAEPAALPDSPAGGLTSPDRSAGAKSPAESRAAARRRPRSAARVAVGVLAVLALALAALTVMLVQSQRRVDARAGAAESVLSPAKTAAARILSYDYRHLQQDSAAAADLLTGAYKGQYQDAMRKLIIPQAPKQQAVVTAEVLSAGVSSVNQDGTQAVVVVFANQTVSTASLTQPRIDQLRVRLTMDRMDGRWLVSKVDSL